MSYNMICWLCASLSIGMVLISAIVFYRMCVWMTPMHEVAVRFRMHCRGLNPRPVKYVGGSPSLI